VRKNNPFTHKTKLRFQVDFSRATKTFNAELIHRKYAFKAALRATESAASTFKTKNPKSDFNETLERPELAFPSSGAKASIIAVNCFSEEKLRRTVADVFTLFYLNNNLQSSL
jgi:hypothetical protein